MRGEEQMADKLIDQVVVITGASRGIGRNIALERAEEEAHAAPQGWKTVVWPARLRDGHARGFPPPRPLTGVQDDLA